MWKYIYLFSLILFIAGAPKSIYSQGLSLSGAVDQALNHNLGIRQSASQMQQHQAMNSGTAGLYLPKVTVSAGYTWFNGNPEINMEQVKPAIDDMAGKYGAVIAKDLGLHPGTQEEIYNTIVDGLGNLPTYNLEVDFNQFPNASITAVQPLFTGGKIISTKNISNVQSNLARIGYESKKDVVTKEVIDNYLMVLLLDAIVDNRESNLEAIKKHVENSTRLVDEGIITRHTLLKAEVAQSNAERLLRGDQSRLTIARMNLNRTLNYSQDTMLLLSDSLRFNIVDVSLEQMKEKAQKEQILLQIADQKKQLAEYSLDLERSDMMPKIFAYANYSFFNSFMPVIMPPFVAGIQLEYTIFNGMSDQKKVKAAKYFNEEAIISKENTERKIDFLIEKSFMEMEDAKYRYVKMNSTVKLANEHQKIVQRRFDEGIERSVDVVDSHMLAQTTQIEQLMTLFEYYIALTNLYFAVGEPEEVINIIHE